MGWGGAYLVFNLIFPKSWSEVNCFFVIYSQKSQKDPVTLEELCNITPLASLGLLHKVGWAYGQE